MTAQLDLLFTQSYEHWFHTHYDALESNATLICPSCNFTHAGDDTVVLVPCLRCHHEQLQTRPTVVTNPF